MGIIQKALSKRQVRDFAIVYYFGLFMFHVAAASPWQSVSASAFRTEETLWR